MKKAACPRLRIKRRSGNTRFNPGSLPGILALLMSSSSRQKKVTKGSRIIVICYDESGSERRDDVSIEEALSCIGKRNVTWINIVGPDRLNALWSIAEKMKLHPFIIEDAVENRYGRPKIEDFQDHIYMTWNILKMHENVLSMEKSQTGIILGKNYLISLQSKEDRFGNIERLLQEEGTRIRNMGADYLLYSMLDWVMTSYFQVSDTMGEWVERLQDQAMVSTDKNVLPRIATLRRQLITFRRAIWPLREQVNELEKGESPLIGDNVEPYFRGIYDHTVELMDSVDTSRDMLSEMINVYQTNVTNQLNQVVKILTIISVIFVPTTFIASWYGMNFKNMPELSWPYSYPIVLLSFLTISVVMLVWFKRRGWF